MNKEDLYKGKVSVTGIQGKSDFGEVARLVGLKTFGTLDQGDDVALIVWDEDEDLVHPRYKPNDDSTVITFEEFKRIFEEPKEINPLSDIGDLVQEALIEHTLDMDGFEDVGYIPQKYFDDIVEYVEKRIQTPEPQYKAFDVLPEEYFGRRVVDKKTGIHYHIIGVADKLALLGDKHRATFVTVPMLFQQCKNLDGTPIGQLCD